MEYEIYDLAEWNLWTFIKVTANEYTVNGWILALLEFHPFIELYESGTMLGYGYMAIS